MDATEACLALKDYIELDDDVSDAYETAIDNPTEYSAAIRVFCDGVISSIELGQSLVGCGELVKHVYNATHRLIDGEIIDLPGAEHCKSVGESANVLIQQVVQINQMSEEYAATQLSCNATVDMSYA